MKWKWLSGMAFLGALVGFIGTVEAGPVMDVPPGGGGGGGNLSQNVFLGNGYDNTLGNDSFWDAQAWGNANGALLTESIGTSFWFEPAGNPQPGNVGRFNLSINAQGSFFPSDGNITPEMQRLADNPLSVNGTFRINEVTIEQNDKLTIYSFDPTFQLFWDSQGYLNIWPEHDYINGSIYANVWIEGGQFTNSSSNFELAEWDPANGPRPDWLSDWTASFNFSGLATPSSVTIVPEPAALVLLGGGAIAMICRRRRLPRLQHNKIS